MVRKKKKLPMMYYKTISLVTIHTYFIKNVRMNERTLIYPNLNYTICQVWFCKIYLFE